MEHENEIKNIVNCYIKLRIQEHNFNLFNPMRPIFMQT